MGFELPPALAGDDNEVTADTDGIMKVLKLTGGVAVASGIVAAGVFIKNRASEAAGADGGDGFSLSIN